VKAVCLAGLLIVLSVGLFFAQDQTITIDRHSYAAIAYSPSTGKYGYSYDLRNRAAAERVALEKCGAEDARIVTWVNKGFIALAVGSDKSCWGVGWSYGNGASNTKAKEFALEDCKKRTTSVQIAIALSSDGQYIWDALEHTIVIDKDGNIHDGHGRPLLPSPSPSASATN
jgi:serine/threonine-protein kinase